MFMKISHHKHNCDRVFQVFKSGIFQLQDNGVLYDFTSMRLMIIHHYANT